MRKSKVGILSACVLLLSSCGSTAYYSWQWNKIPADGHRTGVTAPNAENAVQALGVSNGEFYSAPNGKIFVGGATPEVADILFSVQPEMADLKTVIGYSEHGMGKGRPESPLGNWAADVLLEEAARLTGKRIDVSILNGGGIRCDIPKGEILKEDLVSMFPFKNYVTVVTLKGKRLREIFTQMAEGKPECIGGARIVISDHALESVTVGGKPLDDDAVYNLATIDFLLTGGDKYFLGQDALSVQTTDVLIGDVMLPRVLNMTAAGKSVDYQCDGRVQILK